MDLIEVGECLDRWIADTKPQLALPKYGPANLDCWIRLYRPEIWEDFKQAEPKAAAFLEQALFEVNGGEEYPEANDGS